MTRLYVLYDDQCEFCRRCRVWLGQQPAYVPLVFMPFRSEEAGCRFPGLEALRPEREIVVISDAGDVWQGAAAYVTCLWALREYREWSQRMAHPALLPMARRLCEVVAARRHQLSGWLAGSRSDEEVRRKLEGFAGGEEGDCGRVGAGQA